METHRTDPREHIVSPLGDPHPTATTLDADTTISVTQSKAPAPATFSALSPVFVFSPDGTVFRKPITVTLPFSGDGTNAKMFWSNSTGGYDPLEGATTDARHYAGQVTHFSTGFIGQVIVLGIVPDPGACAKSGSEYTCGGAAGAVDSEARWWSEVDNRALAYPEDEFRGANDPNDGQKNTNKIESSFNDPNSYHYQSAAPAALFCARMRVGGHDDWFLPARNQLLTLRKTATAAAHWNMEGTYWSSTETNGGWATAVDFKSGPPVQKPKRDYEWIDQFGSRQRGTDGTLLIRCVRNM